MNDPATHDGQHGFDARDVRLAHVQVVGAEQRKIGVLSREQPSLRGSSSPENHALPTVWAASASVRLSRFSGP